jgi:hypothetical protein
MVRTEELLAEQREWESNKANKIDDLINLYLNYY